MITVWNATSTTCFAFDNDALDAVCTLLWGTPPRRKRKPRSKHREALHRQHAEFRRAVFLPRTYLQGRAE